MACGARVRAARRVVAGAAVLALAFGLGGCSYAVPSLGEAEPEEVEQTIDDSELVQAGTLTVALDTTDAPQVVTTSKGELEGYYVDVAEALAQNMGLKVAFVRSSSPSDALESGKADVYLGSASDGDASDVTTKGELLQNATAVFGTSDSRTNSTPTVTSATLAKARVGVQDGSASQEALASAGVTASSTYSNVNECLEALASGEVDYVACDATAGGFLARSYENVFFAGIISSPASYGIAYSSSATGLSEDVDSVFETLSTDGTLDAIHQIWYGPVPLSLSSETVSGVTLPEAGDDSDEGDASESAASEAVDDEQVITEDINSLE